MYQSISGGDCKNPWCLEAKLRLHLATHASLQPSPHRVEHCTMVYSCLPLCKKSNFSRVVEAKADIIAEIRDLALGLVLMLGQRPATQDDLHVLPYHFRVLYCDDY